MPKVIQRSVVSEAISQRIGRFSVPREELLKKLEAVPSADMVPLSVILGAERHGLLATGIMQELDARLGVQEGGAYVMVD